MNTEKTQKYDPNRLFRKGDIVEPCTVNGRWLSHTWENRSGIHYEVTKDEDPLTAHLFIKDPDCIEPFLVHAAFFKLVTPVDETEPYSVREYDRVYEVQREALTYSVFFKNEYGVTEAKAAAEAERDRLNAEHHQSTINN